MAKRFISTEIFADEKFSELSKDGKLFFIYFMTNCDHAGILKLNSKLCEFLTGVGVENAIKELGNSLVTVKENVYLMPKFLTFQYPGFPNCKFRAALSALNLINNIGISPENLNSYLTVSKELPNSYLTVDGELSNSPGIGIGKGIGISIGISKGISKGKGKGKQKKIFVIPTLNEVTDYCAARKNTVNPQSFLDHYTSNGWKVGKTKMVNWEAAVRTWEKNNYNTEKKESDVFDTIRKNLTENGKV